MVKFLSFVFTFFCLFFLNSWLFSFFSTHYFYLGAAATLQIDVTRAKVSYIWQYSLKVFDISDNPVVKPTVLKTFSHENIYSIRVTPFPSREDVFPA